MQQKPSAPNANGEMPHDDDPAADNFVVDSSTKVAPQMHTNMNGNMPPQQVYVENNNMGPNMGPPKVAGLETQFQALGIHGEEGTINNNHEPREGEVEDSEGNDGAEGEDDPLKLFVGQVPKDMNEEDIFPTFDSFGPLKDVAIIRDKHTGLHRGCAFVTFWSSGDAERAQESLHDNFTFPGARRPAQVKPAEPSVPENKLFIGMLSRKAGETEVREIFAPYGEIKEIYMIRNADGSSKCAAFLRYVKREAALQAIESLNNNVMMDGSARPLIVKFADNKHQKQQRHMRNVRRQELMATGAGPGYPGYQVPQVPPPMGMAAHPGGPQYPMPPHQYGPAYGAGNPPPPPHPPHHPYMYPPHQYGPAPPYGYRNPQEMRPPNPRPREGPAGANLFVYHLPHDLTDADLATAFNPFGNVISAKVYVDKYTGESKGFGFVSYDSVMSAEAAIEQMNGFQIGNKRLKVQHKRVHNHGQNGVHNGMPQQQPMPQAHYPVPGHQPPPVVSTTAAAGPPALRVNP
ncbi:Elav-like family member [Seminavis robusta]|uniref:Elav-like family member n=1 Tax=Seminavis robusta TaxID=568900 RepID=A0A9N8DMP8_9STRA|nr:Elav-like family member [Seminavis robusta]|eukprot:Sro229_g093050.1 Elav-like family member (517) ;mRNA; f:49689-51521